MGCYFGKHINVNNNYVFSKSEICSHCDKEFEIRYTGITETCFDGINSETVYLYNHIRTCHPNADAPSRSIQEQEDYVRNLKTTYKKVLNIQSQLSGIDLPCVKCGFINKNYKDFYGLDCIKCKTFTNKNFRIYDYYNDESYWLIDHRKIKELILPIYEKLLEEEQKKE